MARNGIAGSSRGKSATARYYQKNKKARAVKDRYNTAFNKKKAQRKKRSNLNKWARKKGIYGKRWKRGIDGSHTKGGKIVSEKRSKNRARNRGKK